ncbi:MAG: GxxExxY protein [Anaerolineales bacterium]|nr:GxxExxY protein [Anaerolineales bacterium]
MKQLSMEELNKITEAIIGAAIEVHRHLGPGLLESAYRECLRYELIQRGYDAQQEVPLPLTYKDIKLDCGYRLDLLVNDAVIVEIKSVESLAGIHEAQLLSYLKISGGKIGLLLNFNVKMLKHGGIKRLAN